MKLKGIGPVEHHVEKVVLAIVSAVFLGVLAMQFLTSPNDVEIGGQKYKPQNAFRPVEQKALEVASQVNASSVSLPEMASSDLEGRFQEALGTRVAPHERIVAFGGSVEIEGEKVVRQGSGEGEARIAEVEAPAPATPMAATYWSTIDPYATVSTPELADVLPAEQPFDKAAVTLETTYDGTALRQALLGEEDGVTRPMPPNWWRGTMAIFRVEAQRQAQGADGTWGEPELVSPMPGTIDMVAEAERATGFAELAKLVQTASSRGREVQRPDYYPVIAGPGWVTPSERAQAAEVELNRSDAERELAMRAKLVEDRTRLEEEAGQEPDEADRAAHRQWERSQAQIERLDARIEDVDTRLEAMGVDPEEGLPDEPTHDPEAFVPESASLLETSDLVLWTNDMEAVPGTTYRYRMRVLLSNPAFGRAEALEQDQRAMAAEPLMPSAWSAWSSPVSLAPETQFFVTSASVGDPLDANARATAELYRFFYGYWRRATVTLEPGDVLAKDVQLPDPELLPIFDLTDAAPGGRGRGGQAAERAEPEPGPTSLAASVDAFLLDVSRVPTVQRSGVGGSARPSYEVLLRDVAGRVAVRRPAMESSGEAYKLVRRSSEVGERQGEPEAVPEEDRRPVPPIEREPERIPYDIPGKGPGGGGGGGGG